MKYAHNIAILFVLLTAVEFCAQQQGAHEQDANVAGKNDWPELSASMRAMHAGMKFVEPSGSNDVDFVRLMLPHHQAAIDMAKAQLEYGNDPQIRRLAQEIITDQQSEIELMQLWLKQHDAVTNPGARSRSHESGDPK